MSDRLIERIKSVIETEHRWRSAPLMLGVESRTCTCGITFATTAEHHIHVYEQVAAAARAFIGDELHEFGEQHSVGAYGTYGPPAIALSDAESIARGDTK